jgi:hypothetical protein
MIAVESGNTVDDPAIATSPPGTSSGSMRGSPRSDEAVAPVEEEPAVVVGTAVDSSVGADVSTVDVESVAASLHAPRKRAETVKRLRRTRGCFTWKNSWIASKVTAQCGANDHGKKRV